MRTSDYSQLLGNHGNGYTIAIGKLVYKFAYPCDRHRAWYEQWMKQSELESIESADMKPDDRDRMRAKFLRAVKNGEYKYGGTIFNETMATEVGVIQYAKMLLVDSHPDITDADIVNIQAKEPYRMAAVMALIHADSSCEIRNIKGERREVTLQEVYRRLTLPIDRGGMGVPLDILASLTDRQKMELLTDEKKEDEAKAEYSPAEREAIDKRLRDLAHSNSLIS